MALRSVSRSLYKTLLRRVQTFSTQFNRGLPVLHWKSELNWFNEYLKGSQIASIPELKDFIRSQFRSQIQDTVNLNLAFGAARAIQERNVVLQQSVWEQSSRTTTGDLTVDVENFTSHADLEGHTFFYRVHIRSSSKLKSYQLQSRHWEVMVADGTKIVVDGEGVVGQTPIFDTNNAHFSYSSHITIPTYFATMSGYYRFVDLATNIEYKVLIDPFSLHHDEDEE